MAISRHRVIWRIDRRVYELDEQGSVQLLLASDKERWLAWLVPISSFSFQGQQGPLTVRKEARPRGDQYWYAFRRVGPKMVKKYLGRTADLTLARLEEIASALPPATRHAASSRSLLVDGQSLPHGGERDDERATIEVDAPPVLVASPRLPRDPLLATKLYRPRPRSQLITRSHLIKRLQQGMERALTLVSTPAGFGKTTLLAQWLAERGTPVAWLSLDPEDNEPLRFFSYLFAALQTLHPQLGGVARALLEVSPGIPLERVLTLLINDLLEYAPGTFALVLDDYHVIEVDAIHRAMGFLLEHLPPQMHLVIATRADPPLPLIRLRGHGQLTEVRAADLRFDLDETRAFLHTVMGLDLSVEALAALECRTEGWIAGLQLAGLTLQGRTNFAAFLRAFTGSHRLVLDYLTEEVISRQPAAVQSFLLSTSVLERLNGPLCDEVTGQQRSQARLAALDQANLFVVALDDERHWYRYHHLFAEALLARAQQSDPSVLPHLHLRASRWYEQQGLFAEAVQHAFAAADVERAAGLIEQIDVTSLAGLGTADQRVLGWLSRLPESLVCRRPLLCIIHAIALIFIDQPQEAEARLQTAECCLNAQEPSEQVFFLRGHIAATRAVMARFSGDLARSVVLAQQALALVPHKERTPGSISRLNLNVAHSFLVSGDVTAPQERLAREMVASLRASENQSMTMRSLTILARLQILQGRLRQAAETFEEAARVAQGREDMQSIMGSPVYHFGLAEVMREWNELNQAEYLLEQGMELVEGGLTVDGEAVALGYTTLARLLMARGEYDQALTALDTFTRLASERSFASHLIACGAAIRAHIQLARGNRKAATSWIEQCGLNTSDDDLWYLREREYLILARVRIAEGRDNPPASFLQDISCMLDRRFQDAEAKARGSSVLELLLLQALAFAAQGERNAAFAALSRALPLAEPEGYVRLFVDEGAPVRDLLRQAAARGITPHYIATLLAAFGEPEGGTPPSPAYPDGLTAREVEVLRLVAQGWTDAQVANRLVISPRTVQGHLRSIYNKMNVASRSAATRYAVEHKLI